MRVGVDFDNTIVCYDSLFHRVALDEGLIPPELPKSKSQVRDFLRREGLEDAWTRLQGYVYGPRIVGADPFPGAREALRQCLAAGTELRIISHKTRRPYAGEPFDLHESAMRWLTSHKFFAQDGGPLRSNDVFFEPSNEAKIQRIGAEECLFFLDDLPEFLKESTFPTSVHRVLFDPRRAHGPETGLTTVSSWLEFAKLVTRTL